MSLDTLQAEANLQKQIIESVKTNKFLSKEGLDLKNKLLENLATESDTSTKVRDIQSTINKLLKEQEKKGKKINQHYIDQLKSVVKVSKKELEINKAKQSFKKTLMETVGLSNEYVKAFKVGGAAALGFMAMESVVKAISSTVGKVVGLGKELYINFGLSAGEATEIALQTAKASFSIEGLLYGTEALAEAAKSSVEYFGTISNLTMDSQKNIATLNKLGVDATKSVQLDKIFKDAAGDGSDLTDSIKVIAKKEGVTAKKLFEGMADDMSRLIGATEDEIKAMAKTNAQLIKRGLTMKQLEDISNNVLNIEQSMRAEAKARAFIGRDINANGVRQAAIALQNATTDKERNAAMLDMSRILEEQVGSADDFNKMSTKQRQLFAEAYGMSVGGITEMLTKQQQFNELQNEYNDLTDEQILKKIEENEQFEATKLAIIDSGKEMGNLSMAMLPALASFKQLGGENTMIWKGFSKATKGAGNLLKKLYEMTAGKLLGKLGGIGKSLGGDMVKSKSGKLFSKDSPQGKMITNLSGKKGQKVLSKAGDQTQKLSSKVKDVKTKGGGPGGFLKSLGEGLESMGKNAGKKLLGAVVLGATVAIVGGGFAIAMKILGDVDPAKMLSFSISMGILGATLALLGSISGNVLIGAAALSIVAIALIPAAFAFSLLENVDTSKMIAFSIALPLLALAAAGLGFIAPFILAGAAAIGVLGMALIPAATAFSMLGDSNIEGIIEKLSTLSTLAGPLMGIGAGLVSIAYGLSVISMAGIMAMPILGMLIGLAAVAPALSSLADTFNIGGSSDSTETTSENKTDTMGELLSEIKGLRQDLQAQPIMVNVDGKVVSKISRVQSRQSVSKKGFGS